MMEKNKIYKMYYNPFAPTQLCWQNFCILLQANENFLRKNVKIYFSAFAFASITFTTIYSLMIITFIFKLTPISEK